MDQNDETVLRGPQRTEFDYGDFDHSSIPFEDEKFPVIIIGSSMVGMSLGILLGHFGIKSISIDRHPSTAKHPRAALFLLRTAEIFRQIGLEQSLQSASSKIFDLSSPVLIVEQLVGGRLYGRVQEADMVKLEQITPSRRLWLTQNDFEPWLRSQSEKFGTRQLFSTTVVHYEESANQVLVVTKDNNTGVYEKYRGDYLVACDGNRSPVRRKEGIEWSGPGVFGNNISINYEADLARFAGDRNTSGVIYVQNQHINACFRPEAGKDRGFLIVISVKDRIDFQPDSVTEREARDYIAKASGINEEFPLKIESINYWTTAALNSQQYQSSKGRLFLAGDAAHVMPPTGAMGGNTGIQDVHNLAWKPAYVLKGWADPALLASYDLERRPAAGSIMQQAFTRYVNRVADDKTIPHFPGMDDEICELGYRYLNGAFVFPNDHATYLSMWEDPYAPMVLPGSRIPHVWLSDKTDPDIQISTLDLVRTHFTLLTADADSSWISASLSQIVTVDTYAISQSSSPIYDKSGNFKAKFRLIEGEAILVRPDGLICWRGVESKEGPRKTLSDILGRILREPKSM